MFQTLHRLVHHAFDKASALNELGVTYMHMENYANASKCFKDGVSLLAAHPNEHHELRGPLLLNLGDSYYWQGQWAQAKAFHLGARKELAKSPYQDPLAEARCLGNAGRDALQLNQLSEAERLLEEALNMVRAAPGAGAADRAHYLSELARAYRLDPDRTKQLQALSLLKEARDLLRDEKGRDHPDVGVSLIELGVQFFFLESDSDALTCFSAAKDIFLKKPNAFNRQRNLGKIARNEAQVYRRQGKKDLAAQRFREAEQYYRAVLPEGHPDLLGLQQDLEQNLRESLPPQFGIKPNEVFTGYGKPEEMPAFGNKASPFASTYRARKKWALVIGISESKNASYHLQWAARDAQDFAGLMRAAGFSTEVITNERATKASIMYQLQHWLLQNASAGDLAVVYISSHGTKAKAPVITCYDTDPDNIEQTAISKQELDRFSSALRARCAAIIVLDVCYSAALKPSRQQSGDRGFPLLFLAASSSDQESHESRRRPSSVFSFELRQALSQQRFDWVRSFETASKYVRQEVMQDHHKLQTPVVEIL